MISRIEGKVLMRGDRFLIIEANGIGYKIFSIPKAIKNPPSALWTHLHVREDAMELYGFGEYAEMQFFEMLIQISGIGPKSALGVLSVAPLDTIKKAISSGETSYLTKVSGIGRKTAEKIVLELRDKLGALESQEGGMFKDDQDVLSALESLGYSRQEAREGLKKIPETIQGVNQRIKEVLKILGKQ
jgi:holliday junction DNA helicase RuvA